MLPYRSLGAPNVKTISVVMLSYRSPGAPNVKTIFVVMLSYRSPGALNVKTISVQVKCGHYFKRAVNRSTLEPCQLKINGIIPLKDK